MILEGKTLAAHIRAPLPARAAVVRQKLGRPIKLAAIGSLNIPQEAFVAMLKIDEE